MHKILGLLLIPFLLTLLTGCAAAAPQDGVPIPLPSPVQTGLGEHLPELSGDWQLQFRQSGGYAGLSRTLEISTTGAMNIDDGRSAQKKTAQLTPEKLAELTRLVGYATFKRPPQPPGCADCFLYNLQLTTSAGVYLVQVDEVSLSDSGLQDLVDFLLTAMQENGG